jgi:hypothetical protein
MSIKIQEGRRYVMCYGGITAPIKRDGKGVNFWGDGVLTWCEDGKWCEGVDDNWDIIAEYIPQPEPLPCTLRAGGKYDTVTPSGEAGPIVELAASSYGHRNIAPYIAGINPGELWLCTPDGVLHQYNTDKTLRIVREHVPQPTPIERLETLVGRMKETPTPLGIVVLQKEFIAEIDAALADLKATVKP